VLYRRTACAQSGEITKQPKLSSLKGHDEPELLRYKKPVLRMLIPDILAPNQVCGLRSSGGMRKDRRLGLIRNLPEGLSEMFIPRPPIASLKSSRPIATWRNSPLFFHQWCLCRRVILRCVWVVLWIS
jgi:hypothetical protein